MNIDSAWEHVEANLMSRFHHTTHETETILFNLKLAFEQQLKLQRRKNYQVTHLRAW